MLAMEDVGYSHMKRKGYPVGTVVAGGEPKLTIRIIGRCNFRCPACSTFSSPERKGIMRLVDFKEAIDILVNECFQGVVNISGGETTLHPNLAEMVSYASNRLSNARIVIFTNGYWIGRPRWRQKLSHLLVGKNVLIRFSLDRQHAEGAVLASGTSFNESSIREIESARFKKARAFLEACLMERALPSIHFDFAFKGTRKEAKAYMFGLDEVPLYLIQFQKDPVRRSRKMGYFAIDLDENNHALVYLTLGHISADESLGGIENLSAALRMNRMGLKTKGQIWEW